MFNFKREKCALSNITECENWEVILKRNSYTISFDAGASWYIVKDGVLQSSTSYKTKKEAQLELLN